MEFLRRFVQRGIKTDTDLKTKEILRNQNLFILFVIAALFITGLIGIIFSQIYLVIFDLTAFFLVTLVYMFLPPYKRDGLGTFVTIILLGIVSLLNFYFVQESSFSVLVFMLLFPFASTTILKKHGLLLSVLFLAALLVGNFFPLEGGESTVDKLNIVIYIVAYIVVLGTSAMIRSNWEKNVDSQINKVTSYESEIHDRDEFITQFSHKLRTSLSNITLINNLVHDARMTSDQKELLDTLRVSTLDLINNVNELVEIATPSILDYKQSILSFNLKDTLENFAAIFEPEIKLVPGTLEDSDEPEYNLIGDPNLLRTIVINLAKGIAEFQLTDNLIQIRVRKDYETQNMFGLKLCLCFFSSQVAEIEQIIRTMSLNNNHTPGHFKTAAKLLTLTGSKAELHKKESGYEICFFQDFSKDLTRKIEPTSKVLKHDKKAQEKSLNESTILLVEDNAINQKIVLLSLDKVVKKIDVANNGKEALDMFGTKKYDAILMDIQMPVMDGITATKKIREIEATSDARIPIIAITANALTGDRDNCLAAGADEYLSKPFQVEDLISKIKELLA